MLCVLFTFRLLFVLPGFVYKRPRLDLFCCCCSYFISLQTPHRILVNTHKINKLANFGSVMLGVSRKDDANIVSHRVSIKC
jgi:hypothetical protein